MSIVELTVRYVAFAIIATAANLAAQRLVLLQGETVFWFAAAVFTGTLVGLVIKYLLDKRWIFHDTSTGLKKHARDFAFYSIMGILTTAIFWAVETAFWLVWRTDKMRELGAVFGLAIGYTVKYQLDRRFVFTSGTPAKGSAP